MVVAKKLKRRLPIIEPCPAREGDKRFQKPFCGPLFAFLPWEIKTVAVLIKKCKSDFSLPLSEDRISLCNFLDSSSLDPRP